MSRIAVLLPRTARHVWPPKDPAERRIEYAVDWTARLGAGDELATSTFELPSGLLAENAANTATVATVQISGGAAGQAYEVVNRITTAKGAELEQTIRLRVKTR
ncbi:hypothetical protein ACMA5K_24190 [Bradyrhizobium diazoefficiens]|uniref:phage fiber-tail adaptor protein n=1 Tax=Bradyrhizobium diazoefficiens TaxID=1355477 RepID=UPI000BE8D6A2|nr:hypothetical protein [Bradyrhizobium diazoefficiens]PDT58713.1 hypothetical protein CO678_26135 [Bradyrhizobium diazoefficiens]QLD43844.1 hypothetical protein HUW42_23970 [Bradyrhizobium diazoefficiens]